MDADEEKELLEKLERLGLKAQPQKKREPLKPPPDLKDQAALTAFANAAAREAELFRTAHEYGVDPADLDGDYQSPAEIRLAAQLLVQKRTAEESGKLVSDLKQELETLKQELAKQQAQASRESTAPDVGGPTDNNSGSTGAQQLDDLLKTLPQRSVQRRWLVLQKIYGDPTKVIK